MKKKPDWLKIEREYIKTDISLEKLAIKYKVSFSTIMKHSAASKWNEKRKKLGRSLEEKTIKKAEQKIEAIAEANAEAIVNRNQRILGLNDKTLDAWEQYLTNEDYKKHLVETTEPYKDKQGNPMFDKTGKAIMVKTVKVLKVPYIIAPTLNLATSAINKANLTSRLNEGLTTESSKHSGTITITDIQKVKEFFGE